MKVLKALGWLILVLAIFVGLAVYFTANNLNDLVKKAIEEVGSKTLQTEVRLASADISLSEAKAKLSGLTIHNPSGFSAENIFVLDDIQFDLNLEAILDKTIDITEISVNGMQVTAEQKGTTTNVQALLNTVSKGGTADKPQPDKEAGPSPVDDMLMKVGRFDFTGSTLTLITERWGEQQVNMPVISLKQLGGQQGVPPNQFAQMVFTQLLQDINKAVKQKLEDVVKEKAKDKLEEKEDELKEKYRDKLKDKLGGDDAEQVEGSLKSMLSK